MRRKAKEIHQINVSSTFPLFFWTKCRKCGMEVRRESIWRVFENWHASVNGGWSTYSYYCQECCPTKADAWKTRVALDKAFEKKRRNPPKSGTGLTEGKSRAVIKKALTNKKPMCR